MINYLKKNCCYENDDRYITTDNIITEKHNIKITYGILPVYEEETHKLKDFVRGGTIIVIDAKEILLNKTFKHSDFINERIIKFSDNFKNSLINDRDLIKDVFIHRKKIDKKYFNGDDIDKNVFYSLFKIDYQYIEELYTYCEIYE